MMRSIMLATLSLACSGAWVRAEHAKIHLDVTGPDNTKQTAFVDQTPPESGKNPRPILRAKVGDPIRIEWVMTNVYPHKTLENVVVHFFIARQDKIGQKDLPDLGGDVVLETAFDMDFKPGSKAGQRNTVRIDTPGVYLVRVESKQTQSDHEHFSAVDLVIEGTEAKGKGRNREARNGKGGSQP